MARRLLFTYVTITALTLAIVVVPLGRVFAEREKDRLAFDIERDAHSIGSLVEDSLQASAVPSIDDVLTEYRKSGGRVVIVDREGHSVADSTHIRGEPRDFSTRTEIAEALDGQRDSGVRRSDTVGSGLMYVAVPVASGGVVHGAVRITYPTSTLDARVDATWWRLAALCAVVLAIVAIVGVVIARGVTRPLRHLDSASRDLASGNLEVRVRTDMGAPELRSLARTFNTTAAQLALLVDSQRRFVADASHQLRTPLTALRLRLETLEMSVGDSGRPKLDAAIRETDRLSRLVQSLLVLARSDVRVAPCVPVGLTPIISGRVEAWEPLAMERGVTLESECDPTILVRAVADGVEQMVDNLVSNALDVAPPGTSVRIDVCIDGDDVELHVRDRGPGMSDEARAQAFERFWRRASRANGDAGGFGLGLAIVEHLARQCGGSVSIRDNPDGVGVDVVIEFRRVGPAG